jgi:hypothetical protein
MHYSFLIIKGQDNIIPNGDFEKNKKDITCENYAGCRDPQDNHINLFNSLIYNWEAAIHKNLCGDGKSVGNIYYFDISNSNCETLI